MFHFWTRPKFPGVGELIRPASSDTSGTPNLKLAKAKEVSESENQISKALGREGTPVLETTEKVAFGSFFGERDPEKKSGKPER